MFFKPVRPDNSRDRTFFKRGRDILRRIFEIAVKPIVAVFGLRESKENIASHHLARVDHWNGTMLNRLLAWIASAVDLLPKHPLIRLLALALGAFGAIVGAVKGYNELFPPDKPPLAPPVLNVQVTVPPAPSAPVAPSAAESKQLDYSKLWGQCIPPGLRGGVNDFASTKPQGRQLDESVVFWSGKGSAEAESCIRQLLLAGGSPNAALSGPELGYGSGPALHSALNQRRWTNARILLEEGADPNLGTVYRPSPTIFPRGELALDAAIGGRAPPDMLEAIRQRGGTSGYQRQEAPAK